MNIVKIPNSPFIALGDDANLTQTALKLGTIKVEIALEKCEPVARLVYGDIVIDCGAYIGDTALIFLEKGCQVFAFEPQEDAHFCLAYNCPQAISVNAAVGDGSLVECQQDQMAGNLGTRTVKPSDAGKASIRLDDWMCSYPDLKVKLIKIDVEGHEPRVLDGAKALIERDHPDLVIEVYPEMLLRQGWSVKDLHDRLLALHYDWDVVIGNETEPRWDVWAAAL